MRNDFGSTDELDIDDGYTVDGITLEGDPDVDAAAGPPMDPSQDQRSYTDVVRDVKNGAQPLQLPPNVGSSQDPAAALLAAREWIEAHRSIVHGPAPQLLSLPPRARRRGVCAILIICADGRKRLLR